MQIQIYKWIEKRCIYQSTKQNEIECLIGGKREENTYNRDLLPNFNKKRKRKKKTMFTKYKVIINYGDGFHTINNFEFHH